MVSAVLPLMLRRINSFHSAESTKVLVSRISPFSEEKLAKFSNLFNTVSVVKKGVDFKDYLRKLAIPFISPLQ